MSIPISEIIREIKNNVALRLDILESLLSKFECVTPPSLQDSMTKRFEQMETKIDTLYELLKSNEKRFTVDVMEHETPILHIDEDFTPVEIRVSHMEDEDMEDEEEEVVEDQEVVETEEVVEDEEEVLERQEVVETIEDNSVELTEFLYKGLTLYRDSESYVYQLDSEGALVDTPIGLWDDAKQRIKKLV